MRTRDWLTAYIENVCPYFVGKVVLCSMSFVMTSPAVSKPTDNGVTSNSGKSRTREDPFPHHCGTLDDSVSLSVSVFKHSLHAPDEVVQHLQLLLLALLLRLRLLLLLLHCCPSAQQFFSAEPLSSTVG